MDYKKADSYIEIIKEKSKSWPKGILTAKKKKSTIQYYFSEKFGSKPTYIRKSNIDLAKSLAQRDYEKKILSVLEKNRKCINAAKKLQISINLEQIYSDINDLKKPLISPLELSDFDFVNKWQSETFISNPYPFDGKEIKTLRGETVRSSAEKLIADFLYSYKIPYKYEQPVKLTSGKIVYPDFTVLNVRERKEYIWEHFGMVDHERYRINSLKKIDTYLENGFLIGKNLITTWEDENYPLKSWVVEKYIQTFLQ